MKAGVLDTLDRSDRMLDLRPEGFYGHLMPFYSLYKSEVCDLAKFLQIPTEFLSIPFNRQGLLYTDNISLSYDQIDPVLFLLTEKQLSPKEISREHNIDLRWLKKLQSDINKAISKTAASQFLI